MAQSLNLNPINNTTVITSVSFISICVGLIVFIKKFPLDINLTINILIILSVATTLFSISALLSYIDIARISCTVDDVLSIKFLAYLFGIALFVISAIMIIYH